jgi:hypothetical protein
MPASERQIELIDKLQCLGAPIPEDDHGNPDSSMFKSVENADEYIKKHLWRLAQCQTTMSAAEYGGIPNH